jgi:hypothetical protein
MARLIEIQDVTVLPGRLTVTTGDILWFWATGGRVRPASKGETTDALRLLGAYSQAVVGTTGEIVAPAGPPNTVLFLATARGRVAIEVVTGDPWGESRTISFDITVRD